MEPRDVGPIVGGNLRASDGDRGAVIDVLHTAYADGRLTHDELETRVERAMRSVTFDDLIPLTPDLVPLHGPAVPGAVSPLAQTTGRVVVDRSSTNLEPDRLVAVFGDTKRLGVWRARRFVQAYSLFGDVLLDLRHATFEDDVCTVQVLCLFGDVTLVVPEGVTVRDETVAVFGDCSVAGTTSGNGPTVVVTGLVGFGDLKVKGPDAKLSARLRRRLEGTS